MKKRLILICLVVILAAFLRIYKININPPSLTWDEVAWGYNAHSLGNYGRDEFGRFLPHDYLESFGDFKPPVYAYLDILPVKIFGLNEFAVRLPSAVFGSLTVLVTFFLVNELLGKDSEDIALISALFLAVSPWHINLSRAAFEANVATFFIVTGVWLFLNSLRTNAWFLSLSIISFVLSIYTFNTARVVTPIFLLILLIAFGKKLLSNKKELLIALILGFVLILPALKFLLSPQASLRFKEVNIFSDSSIVVLSNQQIENDNSSLISKIIHNRRLEYSLSFLKHYFDNLNPNFLFIKGDGNPKFSTQDVGQMYILDIPFLLIGFIILFKNKKRNWWIVPTWIILGIVPAATARETPHALRIETTLPMFQIVSAIGFVYILRVFKSLKFGKTLAIFVIFSLAVNFLYYFHGYYAHYPRTYSGEWQYGYKDSIAYVGSVEKNYSRINISDALGRPYIYYLFYLKIDPRWFNNNSVVKRDSFGFVNVEQVGKYYFMRNPNSYTKGKILFINSVKDTPNNAKILKTFYLLNGEPILAAYTI